MNSSIQHLLAASLLIAGAVTSFPSASGAQKPDVFSDDSIENSQPQTGVNDTIPTSNNSSESTSSVLNNPESTETVRGIGINGPRRPSPPSSTGRTSGGRAGGSHPKPPGGRFWGLLY